MIFFSRKTEKKIVSREKIDYICTHLNRKIMANFTNLIAAIKAVIRQNGTNDITGQLMQDTLTTIVGTIGRFATFAGVATPSTNPSNPDQTVFYLATQVGTYVNFGGVQISGTRICAIHNISGTWALEVIITLTDGSAVEIDPALDANSLNPVENRAVYAECQAIRALISGLTPAQSLKTQYLTDTGVKAINGETFNGKQFASFSAVFSGTDAVVINAAIQGTNVLRLYGSVYNNGTISFVAQQITSTDTIESVFGVNYNYSGATVCYYE